MRLFVSKRVAPGIRVGASFPVNRRVSRSQAELRRMHRDLRTTVGKATRPKALPVLGLATLAACIATVVVWPFVLLALPLAVACLVLSLRWRTARNRMLEASYRRIREGSPGGTA